MATILKKKKGHTIKIPTGTKELADSNVNICNGCKNNCRYCYAKKMAIRFGRKTEANWKDMELNHKIIKKKYCKRSGRIMFPSSHDITSKILDSCMIVLEKLLIAENEILITSKPEFASIKKICDTFLPFQNKIQFRFTIGSMNKKILTFWEPSAPNFEERLKSMKYAFNSGYKTSVSIEPFLDFDPVPLVKILDPYTTESIWIGKMNYIARNGLTQGEEKHYKQVRKNYTMENILNIYLGLKDHPKIQWKDSIKKMLNLSPK